MVTFRFLAYDLGKETKQIDNQTTLKTLQPEIHVELQHTYQRCETEGGKEMNMNYYLRQSNNL